MSKPTKKMAWADMTDEDEDVVISKRGIKVSKSKPVPKPEPAPDKKKPPLVTNDNEL
jgi:hypothetical protein